jgi:hypothetical protein
MKDTSRILKWVTASLETLLAIPGFGAFIIISTYWTPLALMLILHIITLVLSIKSGRTENKGSIIGIIASCIGFIPGVGMVLHILSCIFLFIEASKNK